MFLKNFAIALLLLSPMTETNLFAQGHGGGRDRGTMSGQGRGMGGHGWFSELNLTSDQMIKIRDLRYTRMKIVSGLGEELSLKKKEMAALLRIAAPDAKIKEKNGEVHEVQKKISEIHSEMLIEINKILTPEQRIKFSQHMLETP